MYKEALERVAVIMDHITRDVFNLEDYLSPSRYAQLVTRELEMLIEQAETNTDAPWYEINQNCGTVACAVGHAGLNPWFRSQGFKTNIQKGDVEYFQGDSWNGRHSWQAIQEFFQISEKEALYLFARQSYLLANEPKLIAKRIRLFIATDGDSYLRYAVRRDEYLNEYLKGDRISPYDYDLLPKEFFEQEET